MENRNGGCNAYVVLRSDGVMALLDITGGQLPALVHWGADLGDLDVGAATALARVGVPPVAPSSVDEPVRLALLPEHWTGWAGRPGVSGSRQGRGWSPRFTVTAVTVGGNVAGHAIERPGAPPVLVRAGVARVDVEADDTEAGLGLRLVVEMLTGGVLRVRAGLTNRHADPYQVDDLVIGYPVPPVARDLLDLAGRWGRERSPQRRDFTVGLHLREGRRGRTGHDAATVLHAGAVGFGFGDGEVWGVHVGWSGNHTHYAERVSTGEQVLGGGELLLPGEIVLGEGESYESPWVYGSYGRGLDEVARRFHRHLRSRPRHPGTPRPVTLNTWEAVYFDHDLTALVELADLAAAVGVERFVLDDGWFGSRRDDRSGLGDWVVSDAAWPGGLHPLVDRVRGLGMQFGLWVEPEMVNLDSDLARAHPDWIMATGGRLPAPARHQQVLDLGVPGCFAHVRDQLLAILAEYDISFLKWDHNRDLVDAGTQPQGRPGVHRQTLAAYRLMDAVRSARPGLEIEACSSGGARVDLGVLEHTDRVWVSDCMDPHERQVINRWTTQLVPPELMGSHIASGRSHTTGRAHDLDFRAGTALFGHVGVEWDLRSASSAELARLGEWLALHKELRGLLHGGDLVRLDFPDRTLMGHGVVARDRSRAVYSVAVVGVSDVVSVGRVRFPGLEPESSYRVGPLMMPPMTGPLVPPTWWGTDGDQGSPSIVLTGAALGAVGVVQPLAGPDQVVLYLVERVG